MDAVRSAFATFLVAAVLAVPLAPSSAQVVRPLTDGKLDLHTAPALDAAGATVYAPHSGDPLGSNHDHAWQIFSWDAATGAATRVTGFRDGVSWEYGSLGVSDDGQWLAFASPADLTGQNHDESLELFTMRADGSEIRQLTDDPAVNAGAVLEVALSGSANRVLFLADTDPLGTNPDREERLFAIGFDGTGLTQLVAAPVPRGSFSFSDGGTRVVFHSADDLTGGNPDGGSEVFAIQADGTGLRQLTSSPSGTGSAWPRISGNGDEVTFVSNADHAGANPDGNWQVFVVGWDGTGIVQLTPGAGSAGSPSISDDALLVIYDSAYADPVLNPDGNSEIWSVGSDGTGRTALTATSDPLRNTDPVVSGSGNRVAFLSNGGQHPGGNNPDGGRELMVMDGSGGSLLQLTVNGSSLSPVAPEPTPDGTRIVFADGGGDLYRVDADGGNLFRLTSFDAFTTAISTDGTTVVFDSMEDPLGSNPDNYLNIFAVELDGTGLRQLTNSICGIARHADIAANGSWVVYQTCDWPPGELFRVRPDGSENQRVTFDQDGLYKLPRIDDNGVWVVYQSAATGPANPNGVIQVWRIRVDGTGRQQISTDPDYGSLEPDVSGDGDRIVYASSADPFGTNPDQLEQCFLYTVSTVTLTQLTTAGGCNYPRISRDGTVVFFSSSADVFEPLPGTETDLYRVDVAGGTVQRVGALHGRRADFRDFGWRNRIWFVAPNDDGSLAFFGAAGDWAGANADLGYEVFRIESDTPNPIEVSKAAPTVVSWGADPQSRRYDVIRGDVASLADGGGTVDLGDVVCVEDDSPDLDTVGSEDPVEPPPGQGFFYLFRGTQGLLDGPGSYGFASDGRERLPASGDCGT